MNRLFSLFVVAMFLLSIVPIALAENGKFVAVKAGGASETLETTSEETLENPETADEVQTRAGPGFQAGDTQVKPLPDRERARDGNGGQAMAQAREKVQARLQTMQERMEGAQERYLQAKERYQVVKAKYIASRGEVAQVRQQFVQCKATDTNANCDDAKLKVKPFLGNSAEMVLNALERVKAKIEANEEMGEEGKAAALAAIDARIAAVEATHDDVAALGDDATIDDVKKAANRVRNEWRESKGVLKKSVGDAMNAKLGNIVEKAERLAEKLQTTRDRLEAQGKDVSALDAQMASYDEKLQLAKDEWQAAVDLYENAAPGEIDEVAQEAHEHVRAAQGYLKEVRDSLREVVKEIRQLNNGGLELEEDDSSDDGAAENETETEDESEDESEDEEDVPVNETQ